MRQARSFHESKLTSHRMIVMSVTARGQDLAIGAKGYAPHGVGVAGEGHPHEAKR